MTHNFHTHYTKETPQVNKGGHNSQRTSSTHVQNIPLHHLCPWGSFWYKIQCVLLHQKPFLAMLYYDKMIAVKNTNTTLYIAHNDFPINKEAFHKFFNIHASNKQPNNCNKTIIGCEFASNIINKISKMPQPKPPYDEMAPRTPCLLWSRLAQNYHGPHNWIFIQHTPPYHPLHNTQRQNVWQSGKCQNPSGRSINPSSIEVQRVATYQKFFWYPLQWYRGWCGRRLQQSVPLP